MDAKKEKTSGMKIAGINQNITLNTLNILKTISENTLETIYLAQNKSKTNLEYYLRIKKIKLAEKENFQIIVNKWKLLRHQNIPYMINEYYEEERYQDPKVGDFHLHYMIDEYFPNGSLWDMISEQMNTQSPLGEEEMIKIALDVSHGISYFHEHELIHCQLSPTNIAIKGDGTTWAIANFPATPLSNWEIGLTKGNPNYWAPEIYLSNWLNQAVQGEINIQDNKYKDFLVQAEDNLYTYSNKVDIYALGAIMYEMATLTFLCVNGHNYSSEFLDHPEKFINKTTDLRINNKNPLENYSFQFRSIMLNCLQLNPNDRMNIREVIDKLELIRNRIIVPFEGYRQISDVFPVKCEFGRIIRLEHLETKELYFMKDLELPQASILKKEELNKLVNLEVKKEGFINSSQKSNPILKIIKLPLILPLLDYHYTEATNIIHLLYPEAKGGTLSQLLSTKNKVIESSNIHKWAIQLSYSLTFLHDINGINHMNIGPWSIFFDEEMNTMLGDFGLSNHLIISPKSRPDSNKYMPPELWPKGALNSKNLFTHGCDYFSLGAALYELIVGSPPFMGKTTQDVLDQMIEGVNTVKSNVEGVYQSFCELIFHMLDYDIRSRRPRNILHLFSDIYFVQNLQLLRVIGVGGFGKVFAKYDNMFTKTTYAVKELITDSKSHQEMIQTEYKRMKKMTIQGHKNIINSNCLIQEKAEKFHMVLEFANAGDLSQMLEYKKKRRELLKEEEIIRMGEEICEGLEFIHIKNNQVHLDLKPANILLSSKQESNIKNENPKEFIYSSKNLENIILKIGDFGMTRDLSTMTNQNFGGGTTKYCGPERFENIKVWQSDMFSLGVIMYYMCMLKEPFNATSLHEIMLLIDNVDNIQITTNYSYNLKALVKGLLAHDYQKRPSSVETMVKLREIFNNVEMPSKSKMSIPEYYSNVLRRLEDNKTPAILNLDKMIDDFKEDYKNMNIINIYEELTNMLTNINTTVTDLSLQDNHIGYDQNLDNNSLFYISKIVAITKTIKHLNMSNNQELFICQKSTIMFCNSLRSNKSLIELKLRNTLIGHAQIELLLSSISRQRMLKSLDLSENETIDFNALKIFGKFYARGFLFNLTCLAFERNKGIQSTGIIGFINNGLIQNKNLREIQLQEINFSQCDISEEGSIIIGKLLIEPYCPLKYIDLSSNNIKKNGIIELCKCLDINQKQSKTQLKILNLYYNNCDSEHEWNMLKQMELRKRSNIIITEKFHNLKKILPENVENDPLYSAFWLE